MMHDWNDDDNHRSTDEAPSFRREHLRGGYEDRRETAWRQNIWALLVGFAFGCPLVALLILALKGKI